MLARALPADGILFLPATCEFSDYLRQRTKANIISVGNGRGLVRAEKLRFEVDGTSFNLVIEGQEPEEVTLSVPGRHMVTNALLAAGVAWKLGVSPVEIAAGLSEASLSGGRLGRYEYHGTTVIDDTYNANPGSFQAAIEVLATVKGPKILVMGDMGELGPTAADLHQQVGKLARDKGINRLFAVGDLSEQAVKAFGEGAQFYKNKQDLVNDLEGLLGSDTTCLIKGSRSAKMEMIVEKLINKEDDLQQLVASFSASQLTTSKL